MTSPRALAEAIVASLDHRSEAVVVARAYLELRKKATAMLKDYDLLKEPDDPELKSANRLRAALSASEAHSPLVLKDLRAEVAAAQQREADVLVVLDKYQQEAQVRWKDWDATEVARMVERIKVDVRAALAPEGVTG